MCLERRTSQVGRKQAAVRTEGQNSACVLFVFGVNFPWLPGLSAFCHLASGLLVCWPHGVALALVPAVLFCWLVLSSGPVFLGCVLRAQFPLCFCARATT